MNDVTPNLLTGENWYDDRLQVKVRPYELQLVKSTHRTMAALR